ncbi:unnamed protein product [Mycena citricolor]|uniref:Uncharacterized protein n=1 Tax=Mycena citricolor TaxID=2018698 RepID=A0AAD2HKZ1_9AGAR|nr:unnamed protein product [Mycena citricolor]CAK5267108.1 unnamed protein product [Mycena citricolor]CAK5267111.1 unnamed protein product [Mycena citricolor]CAK5275458.1 unnamed protein product [Mycena citricolor]CAK5276823.1 unnamed protein product [Mycena citricolor]
MGRRANYLTLADRKASKAVRDAKYVSSMRGQAQRRLTRLARKDKELEEMRTLPDTVTPPQQLIDYGTRAIPTENEFFQRAFSDPGTLDLSDCNRWLGIPPFISMQDDTPTHSPDYRAYTSNLKNVMHGVRAGLQQSMDAKSRTLFEKGQMNCLADDAGEAIARWEKAYKLREQGLYREDEFSREYEMLEHFLQWEARGYLTLYNMAFLSE